MTESSLIDWDYWPYLWVVFHDDRLCIKDFNGWLVFTDNETLGM
jgi:hypothetical protein